MKKRLVPLLIVLALTLILVPTAGADCWRCVHGPDVSLCDFGPQGWAQNCEDWTGACNAWDSCTGLAAAVPSLSSEFTVASVERIDEETKPAETLVAVLGIEAKR